MNKITAALCPLCKNSNVTDFSNAHQRLYMRCEECQLIFMHKDFWLSKSEQFERYNQHENNCEDVLYRNFLERLTTPLCEILAPNSTGLDFGCGPGPTVSVLMGEKGFKVSNFDPFFFNNLSLLNQKYDFITSTEVFEHLAQPADTLNLLYKLLKPAGVLAIMTSFFTDKINFDAWHYPRDPTHVCFYSTFTMEWIAQNWNLNVSFPAQNVCILKKP